jgi:DNA polymerase I-like protein with 3'-5' exonuclease and polymerase domains
MRAIPYSKDAYRLFHEGAIALAQVEGNGIGIDTEYLNRIIRIERKRIKRLRKNLQESDVMKTWKKHYGKKTNMNSSDQLGVILFEVLQYPCTAFTATGKPKTDEAALTAVQSPFVKDYLELKKHQKILNTYLMGIQREVIDGRIHPFFNLHLARTYRSSSDSPNFQNVPIRDPRFGKLIRKAFIPRPGCRIVELDYSGIEVAVAACYHRDPTMMEYLNNESKDMHRDMAQECFMLDEDEMIPDDPDNELEVDRCKNIRSAGKGGFVFPQFYGDWFKQCAENLWGLIESNNLRKRDGTGLREHLSEQGVHGLGDLDAEGQPEPGTYMAHIQKVEKSFWHDRFPVYTQWKKRTVKAYYKRGWQKTKTGFICQGPATRNQIINYPVQSAAFHCLLRALIDLQNELNKRDNNILIIGQIHDSILADVPDKRLQEYLELAQEITVKHLVDQWDWIITPMAIDGEVTPVDGSWYEKKKIQLPE